MPDPWNNKKQHNFTLISNFTTVNPLSSVETSLITDTATDGHTSFHTTSQVVTSQGSKPLYVKVDPGTSASTPIILLQSLPHLFYQTRSPIKDSPQTYSSYLVSLQYNTPIPFRIHSARHSTKDPSPSFTLQMFLFEDFTSPDIILSYPTSSRLWIVKFKVPNDQEHFPSYPGCHHRFQNSHLQHTLRRHSTEATQQKQL